MKLNHSNLTQLTLSFGERNEATFSNFFPGKNAEIVSELKNAAVGNGERIIYLNGAREQGCSHLLQACCQEAYQHNLTSVYLPLAELITLSPDLLNGLESMSLVCIDDLEKISGNHEWEEAIFHLFNRLHDADKTILIAAHNLPKNSHIQLPDLMSRLSWGVIYSLEPLSDDEKLFVLNNRATNRGINLSEEVGRYLLTHGQRQIGALFQVLDTLDKASLAAKRKLTIPFIKEILQL